MGYSFTGFALPTGDFSSSRLELGNRDVYGPSTFLERQATTCLLEGHAERCRSGRTGRSRKPLSAQAFRGFESLSLRHLFS